MMSLLVLAGTFEEIVGVWQGHPEGVRLLSKPAAHKNRRTLSGILPLGADQQGLPSCNRTQVGHLGHLLPLCPLRLKH